MSLRMALRICASLVVLAALARSSVAASNPKAVTVRVKCELRDVNGSPNAQTDCSKVNGWFTGRLDWVSGGAVLFSEEGQFFGDISGKADEVLIFADGNQSQNTFAAVYSDPATTILSAPDLGLKLWVLRKGAYEIVSDQLYMPAASALWCLHSEDTVQINADLATERTARGAEDTRLGGMIASLDAASSAALQAETAARTAANTALRADLTTETGARTAADTALRTDLTTETGARTAADTALRTDVAAESAARAATAAMLQSAIDAEATDRKLSLAAASVAAGAYTDMQVAAEAAARAAGDGALQQRVGGAEGALAAFKSLLSTPGNSGDEANPVDFTRLKNVPSLAKPTGERGYIHNQTAAPQEGGFNVTGAATVGGDTTVKGDLVVEGTIRVRGGLAWERCPAGLDSLQHEFSSQGQPSTNRLCASEVLTTPPTVRLEDLLMSYVEPVCPMVVALASGYLRAVGGDANLGLNYLFGPVQNQVNSALQPALQSINGALASTSSSANAAVEALNTAVAAVDQAERGAIGTTNAGIDAYNAAFQGASNALLDAQNGMNGVTSSTNSTIDAINGKFGNLNADLDALANGANAMFQAVGSDIDGATGQVNTLANNVLASLQGIPAFFNQIPGLPHMDGFSIPQVGLLPRLPAITFARGYNYMIGSGQVPYHFFGFVPPTAARIAAPPAISRAPAVATYQAQLPSVSLQNVIPVQAMADAVKNTILPICQNGTLKAQLLDELGVVLGNLPALVPSYDDAVEACGARGAHVCNEVEIQILSGEDPPVTHGWAFGAWTGEGRVVLNERAVRGFMLSTVWPPFEIDASKVLEKPPEKPIAFKPPVLPTGTFRCCASSSSLQ